MADSFTKITNRSSEVTDGSIFVAISGNSADGHAYIADALARGAKRIIYEKAEYAPEERTVIPSETASKLCSYSSNLCELSTDSNGVQWLRVDNSRKALAEAADEFYGHPSRSLKLVGITGTNGKTTTVTLLYHIFTQMGNKCGLLSTIANYIAGRSFEAVNTTSDPITINSLMRQMVDEGCKYCFMEVSSIGVEQYRVHALDFNVGIFSNLTHDHLDYHKTFAEYLRCKKMFFDSLGKNAVAITNIDDRNGMVMMQNTRAKVVTCSCRRLADHSCRIMENSFEGMLLKIDSEQFWCPLAGGYNAANVLAVYSAALALGADRQKVMVALSNVPQVRGRLEILPGPGGLKVVIDYAHTPDALQKVLDTLRKLAGERKLTCLFGCGGDRDRTKRPEMGGIAASLSDKVVITSDNSRSENTLDIMEDIKKGIAAADMKKVICLEDRREAIRMAIITAVKDEVLLLAGKGHEDYQIKSTGKEHFDEREIVLGIFKEMEH